MENNRSPKFLIAAAAVLSLASLAAADDSSNKNWQVHLQTNKQIGKINFGQTGGSIPTQTTKSRTAPVANPVCGNNCGGTVHVMPGRPSPVGPAPVVPRVPVTPIGGPVRPVGPAPIVPRVPVAPVGGPVRPVGPAPVVPRAPDPGNPQPVCGDNCFKLGPPISTRPSPIVPKPVGPEPVMPPLHSSMGQ